MIKKMITVLTALITIWSLTGCKSILDGKLDKGALYSTIDSSKALLASKTIGTDIGNVSKDSYDAFNSAITLAENIYNNENSTQLQIDNALKDLILASTTFKNSVIGSDTVKYLYSTEGVSDIISTIAAWEYANGLDTTCSSDSKFNPVIKISREAWNIKLKFSGITAGTFNNYKTLEFKIKANYPKVKAIFDNKSDGSEGDSNATATNLIDFTTLTPLGNGWFTVTFDLSTLDSTKLTEATNLTICLDEFGDNPATMYITDACLKK